MVKVYDKTVEVALKIPKHSPNLDETSVFTLTNSTTGKDYQFEVTDTGDNDFYSFSLDLSSLDEGEYSYGIGCSRGILTIGNYRKDKESKQYNNEKENKQYIYGQ